MDSAFRSLGSLFIVLIVGLALGLSGCENPGSLGNNLTDSGADLAIDTFTVEGMNVSEFNSYSGDFGYVSAGQYEDPLFGNMKATALLKPSLPISSDDTLVTEDAKMIMRVYLDKAQIFGDSLAAQDFDIYEVAERWRGKSFLVQNAIQIDQSAKVGSFTIEGGQDSLDVDISSWIQKDKNYRNYTEMESSSDADSLYQREVFGLGLVPSNNGKIVPMLPDSMGFFIQNQQDTVRVGVDDWAYSLERSNNSSFPEDSAPLYSTFESVINFNRDFSNLGIRETGITKAEILFYQNNTALEQSLQSEPVSVVRPVPTTARLHLVNPNQAPVNLDPGNPIATGSYSETDGAYHFNLTLFIQSILAEGLPENQEFYVTFSNNGVIRPGIIYTNQAPDDKRPKLIITAIQNIDN